MTKEFMAQLWKFSEKARRNPNLVVADAMQGVFADMSQRQPSVKETGGSFEVGKVPVDEGILINSLFTEVNGGQVGKGPGSYIAAVAGYDIGDTVTFAFSAEYAPRIEYGYTDTDSLGRKYNQSGRFMRESAINGEGGWQARVAASARKFV